MAGVLDKAYFTKISPTLNGYELYAASKKEGFKPEDYDTAMGSAPGTAQSWIDKNIPKQPNAPDPTKASTTSVPALAPGTTAGYTPAMVAPIATPEFKSYQAEALKPSDDSLVEKRLSGVLAKGSPLLDLEERRSDMEMNKRGLKNSSIALNAGRRAVYDKALQIVTPDAQTFANAEQANVAAKNRASEFGANASNQATELGTRVNADFAITNANAGNQSAEFTAGASNQAADTDKRIQADKDIAATRVAAEKELSKINADFDMEVQKLRGTQQETSDATMATNNRLTGATNAVATITANANAALAQIWSDPNTSVESKNQATNLLMTKASNDAKVIGTANGIDWGDLFKFTPTATTSTDTTAANGSYDSYGNWQAA